MKRWQIAAGLAAMQLFAAATAWSECGWDRVDLRGDWGTAAFAVEVADTPETRAAGLMHRTSLPRNSGMLFVFESAGKAGFWMKNTLIPLDMLFFDERGVLAHLEEKTVPLSTKQIDGGDNVLAVLEINGGMARLYGMGPGTEIRHPGISGPKSAWSCSPAE